MTVAQLFFDGKIVDASTNYEMVKNKGMSVNYDVDDPSFRTFVNSMALATKAEFKINPTL